jgi:hypothetical protein
MRCRNGRSIACYCLLVLFFASRLARADFIQVNPPPDADKPGLPTPADNDLRCWAATAANLLSAAGYGAGATMQARSNGIFADLTAQFGMGGGWIDTGLTWWLGSTHNTTPLNPYKVVTVYGTKNKVPWANANGAQFIANELRKPHYVGLSISWPTAGAQGTGGHAISAWGDSGTAGTQNSNPAQIKVTDSDRDPAVGDLQTYSFDAYNNPNPGGNDNGNGWYLNYSNNHPFIKHIAVLSPVDSVTDSTQTQKVVGSYKIKQNSVFNATDLHYRVGTDVNILSYKTQLDWTTANPPAITENLVSGQRRSIDVDWNLTDHPVPKGTDVTITSQFVVPTWNAISYSNVHFTYPDISGVLMPAFNWTIRTPSVGPEDLRNPDITGGNVVGSFEIFADPNGQEPLGEYRFMHEYDWEQDPELHSFVLESAGQQTAPLYFGGLKFGHSYGSLEDPSDLWSFIDWMTLDPSIHIVNPNSPFTANVNWEGRLPYPQRETFTIYDPFVPEPSTVVLFSVGLGVVVVGRFRRRAA